MLYQMYRSFMLWDMRVVTDKLGYTLLIGDKWQAYNGNGESIGYYDLRRKRGYLACNPQQFDYTYRQWEVIYGKLYTVYHVAGNGSAVSCH